MEKVDVLVSRGQYPYEVIILKEGYSFPSDEGEQYLKACGTITVVRGKYNIIIDTGGPGGGPFIIEALKKLKLETSDIHYVIGTHGHSDHIGNLNLFPDATFIVSYDICKGETYVEHKFDAENLMTTRESRYEIDTGVFVIATPGHTCSDISLVVNNTRYGTVVIAGDAFEREEDIKDSSIWQANSNNITVQHKSRSIITAIADYIVPGHGPMFKVHH